MNNKRGFMYILKCSDDSFYTGSTKYLKTRVDQHNHGVGSNYTSKRLPVRLVYYEEYHHIALAYNREKQIQGWSRNKKISLILGDIVNLEFQAEGPLKKRGFPEEE